MANKITAFECEHCHNKVLKTKSGINSHEKKCFFNPATKSCMTCDKLKDFGYVHCECGIDLTKRLQTQCDKWHPSEMNYESDNDEFI